jgi:hypothetical protein
MPPLMRWTAAPRANHFDVSRLGTGRHPHHDGSDHDLDRGSAKFLRGLVRLPRFHRYHGHKSGHSIGRQRKATLLRRPDPVPQMLRSEVMAPRHLGSDSTRCDRLGNDPPLLLVAPPPAADDARNLRAPPNDLRVVIDVDHNVHTIRDPKRIAIMHARIALSYVRWEHRLRSNI